jgi:hypothetical protein
MTDGMHFVIQSQNNTCLPKLKPIGQSLEKGLGWEVIAEWLIPIIIARARGNAFIKGYGA